MTIYGFLAAIATVALVIPGQTLLKRGMNVVGPIHRDAFLRPGSLLVAMIARWELWVGAAIYALSAAAWLLALSTSATFAYPFLCLSYFGVALSATVFLGERLTPAQWAGVLLIIAGVAVVTLTA